jgi:hypothetical protein
MLAKCSEKSGNIATALARYEQVLKLGGLKDALKAEAAEAVTRLGPKVPQLVVKQGLAPSSAVAKIDGRPIVADETPRAIDPGRHELRVEAPGFAPHAESFSAQEGRTSVVTLKLGEAVAEPEDRSGLWIGGFASAGVGLLGFVGAGVTGGVILDACGGSLACEERSTTGEPSDGLAVGNAVAWGVGIAGAGVGVALLIYAGVSGQKSATATFLPSSEGFLFRF